MDQKLADFIAGPVMQIIGTCGAGRRPEIARGAGAWCDDLKTIELVFSAWQWPQTVENLTQGDSVAVTFTNPPDYVSYQIKGLAKLRKAGAAEVERSSRYLVSVMSTLMRLGLTPEMISPWLTARDPVLLQVVPSTIFVQTPGAAAGTCIWSAAP